MANVLDFKDIYIRSSDYPKFNSSKIIEDELMEVIVQKLIMVLFTKPGEVMLGDYEISVNLEYYLWQTKISNFNLKQIIISKINDFIPELNIVGYDLTMNLYEGTTQDILYLNFTIKGYIINFIFE